MTRSEKANWISFSPGFKSTSEKKWFGAAAVSLSQVPPFSQLPARLAAVTGVRNTVSGRNSACSALVRAGVLLLCDLVDQGWSCRYHDGTVQLARPVEQLDRDRIRLQLHIQRDRYLDREPVREFIRNMEKRWLFRGKWVSIFSLMRDGRELAGEIAKVIESGDNSGLRQVIRPYIQVITPDATCEFTGLLLGDIWRYFRCTWANRYQSIPGRSLMLLVRDAAAENHPVIGIAALGSSAAQIAIRDEWIGWVPEQCVNELRVGATDPDVEWLLHTVQDGLEEIHLDDLFDRSVSPLSRRDLQQPSREAIAWLRQYAREEREKHFRLVNANLDHKSPMIERMEGTKRWLAQSQFPLFRSKRSELLAMLLRAKSVLMSGRKPLSGKAFQAQLRSPDARQAIQSLIRRMKAQKVGVALTDITICGSIAPYSTLLGGKLVAMLTASPEVVLAYRDRYAQHQSVIASSIAGRPIVRPSHLVFMGTTSLYGTEPTQYTRVHVPGDRIGAKPDDAVRYRMLGSTTGFGTFQFSDDTVDALSTALSQTERGQRVNSIFGEGTSPRLRKIRNGLDLLNVSSDELLLHGSSRLVYGVSLVRNLKRFLLGQDREPDYVFPMDDPKASTQRIAEWWSDRWLSPRVQKPEIVQAVAAERITYPVRHSARVPLPQKVELQMEFPVMQEQLNH